MLAFGANRTSANYSSGNQLAAVKTANGMAIGKIAQIGLQLPLKKNYFLSTGLTYQKLHTTFAYSEDLGYVDNVAALHRIYRTKHIYHNNFFEFAELNIGAGKKLYFGENWGSQITVLINPSYKLKSTGRTLDENSAVVYIEDFDAGQKWFLNAGIGVDLFFDTRFGGLVLGAGLNQSLSKIKLLNDSDLKMQPRSVQFRMGVTRDF